MILGLLIKKVNIETVNIKDYISIILIIVFIVSAILYVTYKKFREIDKELESQKLEQRRLDEKLKIYERLSKIEKRVFENGNKS